MWGLRMNRREYKQLVKDYKAGAREKHDTLKRVRKERKKLSWSQRRELRKKDKQAIKAWKARIKAVDDKHERRAQKKGYRTFTRLQRRPRVIITWVILILIPVILFAWWYSVATRPLTSEQQAARNVSLSVARQVAEEGVVLLKNEDDVLPLTDAKLSIFGAGSATPVYGGGGAGGIAPSSVDSLYAAFGEAGIEYNEPLYNLYNNYAVHGTASTDEFRQPGKSLIDTLLPSISSFTASAPVEMPAENLSDDVLNQASRYSDTALYVISRVGMEARDLTVEDIRLKDDERQTLEKLNDAFEHIIILVNATNAMELGFVEELDSVDAVLWVGAPGEVGVHSIAAILTGEATPSGRLTDTYAYDVESNPAVRNTGDFQYIDENGEPVRRYFTNNLENIYVGYRYYETFVPEAEYSSVVQYPFGYGLSYTSFDWDVVSTDATEDTITAEVQVTNTGEYAGKDVVQLYYTPPFTADGIEKAAIVLGGYTKTELLQPGETSTVTVTFITDSMASYDDQTAKAWVLDEGSYQLKIARHVRDIVSEFGYEQPTIKVLSTDSTTGSDVTNRFDNADGDLIYLSRSNPDETFPTAPAGDDFDLPSLVLESDYEYVVADVPEPTTGVDNGIKLEDLQGLDYDDPLWQAFLDQFTDKELVALAGNGGYWSVAVERLGVPRTTMYDGPAGIRSFLGAWSTVSYPTPVNLSATWNDDLAEEVGRAMGAEAQAFEVDAVYAPSLNLHRSPLGGRNFEYYSEDPLIAGKIGAAYVRGIQETGTVAVVKHYAANDQETNRANYGLYVWATEQSLREIYFRPFELAVKEGDAHGMMSAFNRIGPIWAGGSHELLTDVLRDEWGFQGFVITDAGIVGQGDHFDALQAVQAGNDLMLAFLIDMPGDNTFEKQLKQYLKEDRAGTLTALRGAAHNILYYVLQTNRV